MLLVIDIGNTNITYAVFKGDKLIKKFRCSTKPAKTSDEYAHITIDLLKFHNIDHREIKGVAISSVVPPVVHSIINSMKKYFSLEPVIISYASDHGLVLKADNPWEVGADRIANSVAAKELYGTPVLVADFGTATTYDALNEKGEFCAAVTAPGIRISAKSLWTETAKLPDIQIESPGTVIATNTVTSMQAGLIYGTIGEMEYITKRIMKEMNLQMKVIATGGLGRIIANESDIIDVYDTDLTLHGIRIIYEREMLKV